MRNGAGNEKPKTDSAVNPDIVVRDVWMTFPGKTADKPVHVLEKINLDVAPGEFVCIVGPSGCGKSTLLNILAGFFKETSGQVLVQGEPVNGPDPRRVFIFQERGIFPWLRVRGNIGFGIPKNVSHDEKRRRIDHYINLVGLQGFDHAFPLELSGGMRQRVEIARALAADPEILWMDEPFSALDYITRLKMRSDLVKIWQKERKTILFVTHDIEESVQLADRVLVMTQRPATIAKMVEINIPRPRDMDSPEYLAARDEIFEIMGMNPHTGAAKSQDPAEVGELVSV